MCGIFGFSGKAGKKADLKKLKILGIYNIQRGTDSCGYYYSGNLGKGIDKEANFTKFIDKNEILRGTLNGEVFLGHTRKSTVGANSAANAHPHVIENYVQTHNGTITEPWKLCEQYNVDHKDIQVDSIGLATIIQRHGFEVLHKYKGYAALAMTFMDDSESLYLYHGASREKENGEVWEERPLFILNQPEGIYYSSIEESLNFISSTKAKAESLPHNIVYKIVNGVFTDYEYVVNREDNNVVKATYNYYNGYYKGYNQDWDAKANELPFGKDLKKTENQKKGLSILLEDYPKEYLEQDVYYRRGRFYRDTNILLQGKYRISRDGIIVEDGKTQSPSGKLVDVYYFIRGVMIASENLYNKLLEKEPDILTDMNKNTAYFLSHYSRYPVTSIESESLLIGETIKSNWYKHGKIHTGSFTTKFSSRTYNIQSGELKSISGDKEPFMKQADTYHKDIIDALEDTPPADCCGINNDLPSVVKLIEYWSDKEITEEDITVMPEIFLKFIDMYIGRYFSTYTDAQLEMETSVLIKDLLKLKISFATYLSQYNDGDYIATANITKTFEHEDVESLLVEENRYLYIDFDEPFVNENIMNIVDSIKEQLKELESQADILQGINSDDAQQLAYNVYQSIDLINSSIKEFKKLN